MVKKEPKQPEKDQLIELKEVAKSKLQAQIDEGEKIAKLSVNNDAEIKQAQEQLDSWYDFTKEVLLRIFSTSKMADEFHWAVRVVTPDSLRNFRYGIDKYLSTLKSILKRVDLYDDITLEKAAQNNVVSSSLNKKKVFVVHGRNRPLLDSMFSFLDAIGLEPIEWTKAIEMTKKSTPTISEIVSIAFSQAQAIVILLSGDDIAKLRMDFQDENVDEKEFTPQARANVIFEAGMAMAADEKRTVLVQVGKIRKFSDIQGLHVTHLDNSPEKRQELITKLRNAGCEIRDISADIRWTKAGSFEDKFDIREYIISVTKEGKEIIKPSEKKSHSLEVIQVENLKARITSALHSGDTSLVRDYVDEYLTIVDSLPPIWKLNKSFSDLQDRGHSYRSSMGVFNDENQLKWILNEIEKLIVILQNIN